MTQSHLLLLTLTMSTADYSQVCSYPLINLTDGLYLVYDWPWSTVLSYSIFTYVAAQPFQVRFFPAVLIYSTVAPAFNLWLNRTFVISKSSSY
jgi:hypothetical protein